MPFKFELEFDPETGRRALAKLEPRFRPLMRRCGPLALALRPAPSPFEALAESIVYQQLHGKAAASIFARIKALHVGRPLTPEAIAAAPDEDLRKAGLSRAKLAAVKDLADKAGMVPGWAALRKLDDETILERFTQVRGIGPWTSRCCSSSGWAAPTSGRWMISRCGRPTASCSGSPTPNPRR